MENNEIVFELFYETVEDNKTKMSFAIPLFYRAECDKTNWIKTIQHDEELKNLFMFRILLSFFLKYSSFSSKDREKMKKSLRKIVYKKLKMKDNDHIFLTFEEGPKRDLALCIQVPKKYKSEGSKVDWYKVFEENEKVKNLIRVSQTLIFIDGDMDAIKAKENSIKEIVCEEMGLKSENDIQLEYEVETNDQGKTEFHLILNLPSWCENELRAKQWLTEILPKHKETKALLSRTYPLTIPGANYIKGNDFSLMKQFVHDISKSDMDDIFVRIEQNGKNLTIFITVPNVDTDNINNFTNRIGQKLMKSKSSFFSKYK
jgi:hypothetical protein